MMQQTGWTGNCLARSMRGNEMRIRALILLLCFGLVNTACGAAASNILFVLVDDMGWGDLSCYPSLSPDDPEAHTPTPQIDRLARTGVRFTNGYADHMVCAPTRAGIMAGRSPCLIGHYGFDETETPWPEGVVTLPAVLKGHGYKTALIGKWHVSRVKGSRPLDVGFDRFYGFLGGQHDYFDPRNGDPFCGVAHAYDAPVLDQDKPVKHMNYLTDELTDQAVSFIKQSVSEEKPFFLYLTYNAPHAPLQVPWKWLKPYTDKRVDGRFTPRDIYRAMLENLDWNVGRLMEHLDNNGLREKTLIVFASDNGGMQVSYNGGLRGRKGYFWEGGIRVPLIVNWQGVIAPGQVVDAPVVTSDTFPTFLAAAGSERMPAGIEGVNWLPMLTGERAEWPMRRLFWSVGARDVKYAVRDGRFKLINEDISDWYGAWPVEEAKRQRTPEKFKTQLFDLVADPGEQRDVSAQYPDVSGRLQQVMDEFLKALPPSQATPDDVKRIRGEAKDRLAHPEKYAPLALRRDGAPGHPYGKYAPITGPDDAGRLSVPVIDRMPDLPEPLVLRNWKQVARDMDAFVYDFSKKGPHLPIPWWDRSKVNCSMDVIALPAYIGSTLQNEQNNAYDTITCFGAVLGGTKIGLNKSREAEMLNAYFQKANGIELYLNNVRTVTGKTFWYELFPSLLFYQVYDHYRDTPGMARNFVRTAERWHEAVVALGGVNANFDWTAYDFSAGRPTDNGRWKEPDAAAAVAWLEYMAYVHTGNTKYLDAAGWALDFLDGRDVNPYYECLLPYGAYVAARMNAERGTHHDIEKMVNWIFDGDSPRRWGVIPGGWGAQNCAGLTGSVYPGHEYAFAMNSFLSAGIMLPIVRYDDRFANAFGKWMLNLAVNARYFYSDAWPADYQTCHEWASRYDPENCLAYEGIRKQGWTRTYATEDESTRFGRVEGSWTQSRYSDSKKQKIIVGDDGKVEHVWKVRQVAGKKRAVVCWADTPAAGVKFMFSLSETNAADGVWHDLFSFASDKPATHHWRSLDDGKSGDVYVKVTGNGAPGAFLAVEDIYIQAELDKSPYLMGDPTMMGWAETDMGLYGSVFAGLLGAIVEPSDVKGILRLDCRATESFTAPSYPTHLYYNPYRETRSVTVSLPDVPTDLYDAVSNMFIVTGKSGSIGVDVEPGSTVMLVQFPAGGDVKYEGCKTMVNGVVVDYNNGRE